MIHKWETRKERLLKYMKISPEEKLEWLREMNEFRAKYLPKKARKIHEKLRNIP